MQQAPDTRGALTAVMVLRSTVFGLLFGGVVAALAFPDQIHRFFISKPLAVSMQPVMPSAPMSPPRWADFGAYKPSADTRHVADWVADSGDNQQREFVILDKRNTQLYVFDRNARLLATTPVLLGFAAGDDSVPGIGSRPIEDIAEHERTTPAGRFVGQKGVNANAEDVVWVDYAAAVSMHRVRATVASERRLERLASPTTDDNRISWGCINVPVAFFDDVIAPLFAQQNAVVYVLPEVKAVEAVFGSYVNSRHGISLSRRTPVNRAPG